MSSLSPDTQALRADVRDFIRHEIASGNFVPMIDSWVRGSSAAFTRKLGERGWLGMTWPKRYGGRERSQQDRFVIVEELLAAGAPVARHWLAERQIGISLMRFGSEEQRMRLMPPIARGESTFGACYSEPDVGSDLASVRTRAIKSGAGWRISGTKVWTSQGHVADHLFVLTRSSTEPKKHDGLTMFLVATPSAGLEIRPIASLSDERHFSQIIFDEVEVSESAVIGTVGDGWSVITAELAIERSGPERFLSAVPLLRKMVAKAGDDPVAGKATAVIGELYAQLRTLRSMSISVASEIERGGSPDTLAALVKDLGTRFDANMAEVARTLWPVVPVRGGADEYADLIAQTILHAPSFTLRGGTNEVLRGIIARGLGLR